MNSGVGENNEVGGVRGGGGGGGDSMAMDRPFLESEPMGMTEQDVLLCAAVLRSSMVAQGEELEVVERKLQAMMMQRIFLPGRFHLRTVASIVRNARATFPPPSHVHYSLPALVETVLVTCQQQARLHASEIGSTGGSASGSTTTMSGRSSSFMPMSMSMSTTATAFGATTAFGASTTTTAFGGPPISHHAFARRVHSPWELLQELLSLSEEEAVALSDRCVHVSPPHTLLPSYILPPSYITSLIYYPPHTIPPIYIAPSTLSINTNTLYQHKP